MKLVQAYGLTNGTPERIECGNFVPWSKAKGLLNVYPVKKSELIGFGGAFTDSSAYNYSLLSDEQKKEVLESLFGESGLAYNFCRLCIGSSDFALEEYCYVEDGDTELKTFNIDRDKKYVLPFLKDALAYTNGKIRLFASPWSPPAFMKDNGIRFKGGKLLEEYYELYAEYIVKFFMAYRAEGVEIWGLTPQNEPLAKQTWESCFYTPEDEIAFTRVLKKVLTKHGLDVKLIGWDHNKERLFERADQLFSAEGDLFDGVGFHWYSGAHYEGISAVNAKYPNKLVLSTEFCKTLTAVVDYVSWRYANEVINDLSHGAHGICEWNLILDEEGGPYHNRICGCDAPVRVDSKTRNVYRSEIYHEMYMFSHFIPLELSSGDFYVTCFAIGALISIPVAVMDAPFWVQVVVWAVCSVLSILLIRPHLVKAIHRGADHRESNSDALAGQIGEVSETIVAGGYGRVKLDGDDWKAEAPGAAGDIAKGTRVRVIGHQSIILQVEKY